MRRLNRREYHNTVRDLLGVDYDATAAFPADGTGGAGFDTNGETLYVPPLMMEQYLQAAQQILDRVIVTPPLARTFAVAGIKDGTVSLSAYLDGDYDVRVSLDPKDASAKVALQVDGADAGPLVAARRGGGGGGGGGRGGNTLAAHGRMDSIAGTHIRLARSTSPARKLARCMLRLSRCSSARSRLFRPAREARALHYHWACSGMEPGDDPLQPRKAAAHAFSRAFTAARPSGVPMPPAEEWRALHSRCTTVAAELLMTPLLEEPEG